jgi:hypothetical protein
MLIGNERLPFCGPPKPIHPSAWKGILRTPFAGWCIDGPPRGVRVASKALHSAWRRSLHLVGLDGYAGRRMLGCCRSRLSHFPKTYAESAGCSESNPAPSRSPKGVGKDRSVLRVLWLLQIFVCVRGVSAIPHIYTSVLQALAGRGRRGHLEGGDSRGIRAGLCRILGMNFRELRKVEIQLPRMPKRRSSQNFYSTHSGE